MTDPAIAATDGDRPGDLEKDAAEPPAEEKAPKRMTRRPRRPATAKPGKGLWVATTIGVAVLLLAVGVGLRIVPGLPRVEAGGGAPDFTLGSVDGGNVTLSAFRGRPVLLDFMATWCVPCKKAFPQMAIVYAEYHPKGVEFISIDVDPTDAPNLKTFATAYNGTWILVVDTEGVTMDYAVYALPSYVAVDRSGRIVARATGDLGNGGADVIEQLVTAAMGKG